MNGPRLWRVGAENLVAGAPHDTIVVAAANASAKVKATADRVCTGTSTTGGDQVEIQAAIDAAEAAGGGTVVLHGHFYVSKNTTLQDWENTDAKVTVHATDEKSAWLDVAAADLAKFSVGRIVMLMGGVRTDGTTYNSTAADGVDGLWTVLEVDSVNDRIRVGSLTAQFGTAGTTVFAHVHARLQGYALRMKRYVRLCGPGLWYSSRITLIPDQNCDVIQFIPETSGHGPIYLRDFFLSGNATRGGTDNQSGAPELYGSNGIVLNGYSFDEKLEHIFPASCKGTNLAILHAWGGRLHDVTSEWARGWGAIIVGGSMHLTSCKLRENLAGGLRLMKASETRFIGNEVNEGQALYEYTNDPAGGGDLIFAGPVPDPNDWAVGDAVEESAAGAWSGTIIHITRARPPVRAITGVNAGAKQFTVNEDLSHLATSQNIQIKGSTGNDGIYTITGVAGAGPTTITVSEVVPDATVDGNLLEYPEYHKVLIRSASTSYRWNALNTHHVKNTDKGNTIMRGRWQKNDQCFWGEAVRVQGGRMNCLQGNYIVAVTGDGVCLETQGGYAVQATGILGNHFYRQSAVGGGCVRLRKQSYASLDGNTQLGLLDWVSYNSLYHTGGLTVTERNFGYGTSGGSVTPKEVRESVNLVNGSGGSLTYGKVGVVTYDAGDDRPEVVTTIDENDPRPAVAAAYTVANGAVGLWRTKGILANVSLDATVAIVAGDRLTFSAAHAGSLKKAAATQRVVGWSLEALAAGTGTKTVLLWPGADLEP